MVNDTNATNGSTTDELMAEISQYWDNLEGSNIYELVDSFNEPMAGLSQAAQEIEDWREVKNAEGTTLDMIGRDREAYRPSNDDDVYRFLIYIRYLLSRVQGTIPNIVNVTSTALQIDGGVDVFNTGSPHHIGISIPADQIKNLEMQKFVAGKLQQMIALGYWIDEIIFRTSTPLPLYIGVGGQSSWQTTARSKIVWWTGWKAKTESQTYVGVKGRISSTSIWSANTVWWTGWKVTTSLNYHFGVKDRYIVSSVWATETS